jgi:hypothetical protein
LFLIQEKTTPELYYLSVVLSVGSLVSTGESKHLPSPYPDPLADPSREDTV